MKHIAQELARREQNDLLRQRLCIDSPQQPRLTVEGRELLAFCSNDYLGLANHPEVVAAFIEGARRYGVGSGASHLVTGHMRPHHELEEALAAFCGRSRALLFSSGYMTNLGIVSAFCDANATVIEDRLNHASLIDAARLSHAKLLRYRHADLDAFAQRLAQAGDTSALIVTDGVFSMDGDIAPLVELASACRARDVPLMVDDAHGLGVIGKNGSGSVGHFGLDQRQVPLLVGTLGKAFGTFGAFVAGDNDLIEFLLQTTRTYIYTTALPPAVAYATLTSLRIAHEEQWRRDHLQTLIDRFRDGAQCLGLRLLPSATPIQPILLGGNDRALALSRRLRERDILVTAIRPPTVPVGSARLRVTLSAAHSEQDVDRLLEALSEIL